MPFRSFFKPLMTLIVYLCFSAVGYSQGQSFDAGYQAYMRNQFPLAEAYFKRALSTAKTPEDQAFILKFMGISQYMRGAKRQAAASLLKAYQTDPKTSIYQEEVLDPGVVSFYNNLKERWDKTKPKAKESSRAKVEEREPPPQVEVERKKKPSRKKKRKRKERERDPVPESRSSLGFVNFLPFGLGHYANESYGWGTLYLLGEVGLIVYYLNIQDKISQEEDENLSVANSDRPQEAKDAFLDANTEVIDAYKSDRDLTASAIALTMVVDITHSVISASSSKRVSYQESKNAARLALLPGESLDSYFADLTARRDYSFSFLPYEQGLSMQINIALD